MVNLKNLSAYNYYLPEGFIAQQPATPRDSARLMVIRRKEGTVEHTVFSEIANYLAPETVIILNDTRVIRARFWGRKTKTGGKLQFLLLRQRPDNLWQVLIKGKVGVGTSFIIKKGKLEGEVVQKLDRSYLVSFNYQGIWDEVLAELGEMPLPPYIKTTRQQDREDYQTVYAQHPGAVAAPTAGLHFSTELLTQLKNVGISIVPVTLHVGWGTFAPVTTPDITQHQFDAEYFRLSPAASELINQAKIAGKTILTVGTSATRVMEATVAENGLLQPRTGWSDLFIFPGYRFKAVTALLTNFHLPGSTPLMLVCAFADYQFVLNAYQQAIEKNYRFYSYGDAMLIL